MKPSTTTMSDIAELANVSTSTVSRVLNQKAVVNEETRKAVLKAMEMLSYRANVFARGLASGRSMTIGVVTQCSGSQYYDMLMKGVIQGCNGTGYSPLFIDANADASSRMEVIQTVIDRQVDGLLLLGGRGQEDSVLVELKNKLPTLLIGSDFPVMKSQCITIDNVEAGRLATQHLIEFGHRRIAFIQGISSHVDAKDRLKGYRRALVSAGIDFDPELVVEGDFSASGGMLGVNALLTRGKSFSAIFCANDLTAFGANLALQQRGLRVPLDVSLVGFDDQRESAYLYPPLTTIRQPCREMGIAAADALIKHIGGEPYELPKMSGELMIRDSVRRIA